MGRYGSSIDDHAFRHWNYRGDGASGKKARDGSMTTYRVMVIAEDMMEFCFADNLDEESVSDAVLAAIEDFPCADVFVEMERE